MTLPLGAPFFRNSIAVTDGGNPDDRGRERHRILRELQRELERHPAVRRVMGSPDDKYRELRAILDPAVLGVDADEATLRVSWWPVSDDPEYAFHYSNGEITRYVPCERECVFWPLVRHLMYSKR